MPNIKAVSETVQKLSGRGNIFFFKVGHRSRSKSQVNFFV